MNWLDYVFIGIICFSVIVSLIRGLIREVLSLLIWIGAFWVAYNFVDVGANSLTNLIELPSARHLIAFVALFLVALILGGMINFIVAKFIQKTGLSASDRFFGMFFGILRALIAIVVITFFIQATPLSEDPWWQQSKLAPKFIKISEWVRLKMPDEFSDYFSFIESNKQTDMQKIIENIVTDMNERENDIETEGEQ